MAVHRRHVRRHLSLVGPILAVALLHAASVDAGDRAFQRHTISSESEYSAVAVLDVDRDGKDDILCGGFWYQAPTWKRHFVRNVEHIRGRFDGYSHLVLDVNADGWNDVITVNFRSQSIRWLEHPGPKLGPWAMRTAAEPGSMETGRLVDIDGDGQLDVLPNGQRFAAWWELQPGNAPIWTRHELPIEVVGHGIGFGDVNGDGRGDVIGPQGWAEAPVDPRRGRWVWHPEFHLGRASVPVLVVDVDEDGDQDLVWTRAHGYGVYWLEQTRVDHARTWVHHSIDTSWSQCHSPLWADLDGNGRQELITGKRYMSHEGRDPGAYDPLVSYRYEFEPNTRTWRRWPISIGQQVGFGLDPKVADLDGDHDLDLIVCGRSGLYWLENIGPRANPTPNASPHYDPSDNVSIVKLSDGSEKKIETGFDLGLRRAHVLSTVERTLGALPSSMDRVPLHLEIGAEERIGEVRLQRVSYQVDSTRRLQAALWLPTPNTSRTAGLVVIGSADDDPAPLTEQLPFQLATRGFACVVPQLRLPNQDDNVETSMAQLWDGVRSVDVLESLPQVDGDRLGCVASGSEARFALLLSAFEPRLKATLCGAETSPLAGFSRKLHGCTLAELLACITPRSLAIRTTKSDVRVSSAIQQAAAWFPFFPVGRAPVLNHGSLRDAAARDWISSQLLPGARQK